MAGFSEKATEHKICFDSFLQLSSEIFVILRRIHRDILTNVHRSLCKVPAILVKFSWKSNLLNRRSKNAQISNFVEIHPVGTELFHA